VIISALCSINASKPMRTAVFVQAITYKFDGASGGAPVSNVKMPDVVETTYVSERGEENFIQDK
jgi:hypothetical protein